MKLSFSTATVYSAVGRLERALRCISYNFLICLLLLPTGQLYAHDEPNHDLLIIVPHESPSSVPGRDDSDWVTFAEILGDYKRRTGMSAAVVSLGEIKSRYASVDEAEQVKQAIYHEVRQHGVRFVMLVGDTALFPVRYLFWGYRANGETYT